MDSIFLPQINSIQCIGCELCVRACPHQVLDMVDHVAAVVNPDACTYSGVCQEICPTEAISLVYEIVLFREEETMPNGTH
jgi:formate hydrogenlyase subunit 6/NADH:ubiquinone oxidoreductase subunit I